MRPEAKERARAYLQKSAPAAIAGQGGDNTTHAVACTLAVDFGLPDHDVAELLAEYNRTKCNPQWSQRDLDRHVRSARRTANGKPGEVGKLLNVDRKDYSGPRSPANRPAPSATAPPTGHPTKPDTASRTLRTPFFNVRRADEGAEPRTARTVRTLPFHSRPYEEKESAERIDWSRREASGMSGLSNAETSTEKPSEASGSATKPEPATKRVSEPSAPKLRAIPLRDVKASRDGLTGDKLALWADLFDYGPVPRRTLIARLKWTEERFVAAETWALTGGWIVIDQ